MSVGVSHECAVRFAGASGWMAGPPLSMCFLYMMCYPPGLFARWQYFRRTRAKLEAKALKSHNATFTTTGQRKEMSKLKFKESGKNGMKFMINFNLSQTLSSLPEELSIL